jgi:hypothetical protein
MNTRKNRKHNNKTRKRVFKKSDYEAGDGFLTSTWGPPMWHYLHTMSFNYPVNPTKEDKKNYMNFILSLQNVLPCKYCRINLKTNFKVSNVVSFLHSDKIWVMLNKITRTSCMFLNSKSFAQLSEMSLNSVNFLYK